MDTLGVRYVSHKRVKAKEESERTNIFNYKHYFLKKGRRKRWGERPYKGDQLFEKDHRITEVTAGQRAAILPPEAVGPETLLGTVE